MLSRSYLLSTAARFAPANEGKEVEKLYLPFDADWTDEQRKAIIAALGLDDKRSKRLFEDHKRLTVTQEQIDAVQAAFNALEDDEAEAEEAAEEADDEDDTEAEPDADDADDKADEPEEKQAEVISAELATRFNSDAVDVAGTISEATCKEIETGWLSTEKAKIATVLIWQSAEADAKKSGKSIEMWPTPGSYREKGKVYIGDGDDKKEIIFGANEPVVWDKYEYSDVSEKTGKQVTKQSSFFRVLFDTTTVGKRIADKLAGINKTLALLQEVGNESPDIPKEWRGFGVNGLQKRKSLWEGRQRYGVNRMRDVKKIDAQCKRFDSIPKHEGSPIYSFETETVKDNKGNERQEFVNKNEPVKIEKFAKRKVMGKEELLPTQVGDYSLNAFLRFDVQAAVDKAGGINKVTMDNILATVKRAKKKPATKPTDAVKLDIKTAEQWETVIYSEATFLAGYETAEQQARLDAWLNKRMAAEDGDEFVEAYGDSFMARERVMNIIATRYNGIKAKKASIAKAKAKEEEKKAA